MTKEIDESNAEGWAKFVLSTVVALAIAAFAGVGARNAWRLYSGCADSVEIVWLESSGSVQCDVGATIVSIEEADTTHVRVTCRCSTTADADTE